MKYRLRQTYHSKSKHGTSMCWRIIPAHHWVQHWLTLSWIIFAYLTEHKLSAKITPLPSLPTGHFPSSSNYVLGLEVQILGSLLLDLYSLGLDALSLRTHLFLYTETENKGYNHSKFINKCLSQNTYY